MPAESCGAYVVASRGVVHDAGPNPFVVLGITAPHRFVGAPLCAVDDLGRCTWRGDGAGQRQAVDRRLRRADQHGVDVLAERLLYVGGDVAKSRLGGFGISTWPGRCGTGGTRDGDLHRGGAPDEHRLGAARARGVGTHPFQRLGLVPRPPCAVGLLGPDARGGSGEVLRGERDHRERGVLMDLADRLAAAEPGQRLLRHLRRLESRSLIVAGQAVDRPRQHDDRRRDGGKEHRRRRTAARHGLMLRMCQLLLMFRHGSWPY